MPDVEFEVDDHIAIITINRPDARNSINAAVAKGLGDAYAEIVRNPEIRVGVITGAGSGFCSGMDLKAFLTGEEIDPSGIPYGGARHIVVNKPMIAAIEGFALAGGFELALTCDLIVAARTAWFGLPEVKRGFVASGGGLTRLTREAPPRVALEMLLTGDPMDAEALYRHGVVNRLAAEGAALSAALELAARIAENGPLAIEVSLIVSRLARDWPASQAFDRQKEFTAPVFGSADAQEGARAFAEKRKPNWTRK